MHRGTMGRRVALIALGISAIFHATTAAAQTTLVPAGSIWNYLDDGSDQGTAWRAGSFDDGAWASGPAQLGYGDGDEATIVGYGADPNWKYVTTYFRHTFEAPDPSELSYVVLDLLRDDGAVVYLNGNEIVRSNMPDGVIDFETFAASAISGSDETRFLQHSIDVAELSPGMNCLAVEIHQCNRTSSDISFDLSLRSTTEPPPLTRKAPYLVYRGVNTEMQVLWQLHESMNSRIEWGLDTLYASGSSITAEANESHQHIFTLTDLFPGALYFYRMTVESEIHTGSFRAAPDENATSLKFLAYGDTRSYPEQHDLVAEAMLAARAGDPGFQSFTGIVGDLVYNGGAESDWDGQFFDPSFTNVRALLAGAPYHSAIGNHELPGDLFMKYFPYPFADHRYWSYDYGPVHVAVVDQYTDYAPGTPQYNWLVDDLASTAKVWKLLFLHEPGWSAGDGHGNSALVQQAIQPLCEEYGVAIVFGGHNHYYARAVVNGIQHVTTGGGGAPLHTPNPDYPFIVATARAHHYCRVEIEDSRLSFTAVTPTGEVLDTFEIEYEPAGLIGGSPPVTITGRAHPNPFVQETTIDIDPQGGADEEVLIVDLRGRVVRRLRSEAGGAKRFVWDATDARGRRVPAGVYYYRVASSVQVPGHRVLVLE